MNYSVLTDFITKKGDKFYAYRISPQQNVGAFEATSDGKRNPDMARLNWVKTFGVPESAKYLGEFTSSANQHVYKLWVGE